MEFQEPIDPNPTHVRPGVRISTSHFGTAGAKVRADLVAVGLSELALDVTRDHLHGEQVTDRGHFRVLFEVAEIGERHALAQLGQADIRYPAVLNEFRVSSEYGFREELAARNLDAE